MDGNEMEDSGLKVIFWQILIIYTQDWKGVKQV
jgi:hypothetical protein